MDSQLVFIKTAKGREEIEKRTHRLDSRRRMLLIMVDGVHTAQDVASNSVSAEDAYALLETLWREGFVEPADSSAAVSVPVMQSQTDLAASAATPALPLPALQRAASKAIENILGPAGESLALKLEKTKTVEQFMTEAQKTREAIKEYVGAGKAEAFWKALGL